MEKKKENILFLNGSPRLQGNTANILKTLANALKDRGTGETIQWIDVCKYDIKGCINCDMCMKNGGKCVRGDDTEELMQQILQADVIVFGSPVYWMGITAQLKLLIDKFYCKDPIMHDMKKRIAVISVGAAELSDGQYGIIEAQFTEMAEFLNWTFLFSSSFAAWKADDWKKDPGYMQKIKDLLQFF